ncbi:hypothetical protein CFN78_24315 [Amycolatopsis antarctica]|uniref:DUF742 domain-containing protein n=1 Tax=Amycolatopsis antarctica TaxID=1854586 RepID=A0A263CYQ6_9PSEU|nr:DUF742 domain-containing protein [Amycolatopsis antarctica]OZM70537.1 hypothetical protein CFN78_24315 [Amycolatopsis antarctica]
MVRRPRWTEPDTQTVSAGWEQLHRATEREGLDSPGRFELGEVSALIGSGTFAAVPVQESKKTVSRSRFRPYARTRGRTRPDNDLALEALVSTSERGRRYAGVASVEQRAICDLCVETRSVAEVAAHLRLPLGVVKVMVGDMADAGLVLIHQPGLMFGDRSSREFMERVLHGLRSL